MDQDDHRGRHGRAVHPSSDRELAERFAPLLVLFPEIDQPRRPSDATNAGLALHDMRDYHPRSLELVLANARIARAGNRSAEHRAKVRRFGPGTAGEQLEAAGPGADTTGLYLDVFPGLRHYDRDGFWRRYHDLDKSEHPKTAYVRVSRRPDPQSQETGAAGDRSVEECGAGAELVAIQYWLFYVYNDFANIHEGDWEHIDVVVRHDPATGDSEPVACACSAHLGGYRLPWDEMACVDGTQQPGPGATHPVVYVSQGSHANFLAPRPSRTNPDPRVRQEITNVFSVPEGAAPDHQVIPQVRLVSDNPAGDLDTRFSGFWGARGLARTPLRRLGVFDGFGSGPRSPWIRDTWFDPLPWIDACRTPAETPAPLSA